MNPAETPPKEPRQGSGMSLGAKLFLLGSFLLIPTLVMNFAGAGRFDPAVYAREEGDAIEHPNPKLLPLCLLNPKDSASLCMRCHESPPTDGAMRSLGEPTTLFKSLFEDRRALESQISEGEVRAWAAMNTLKDLWPAIATVKEPHFELPPLRLERGVDADGFLRDGSGFRALRQVPTPVLSWPSFGVVFETWMRLGREFHRDESGKPSRPIALLNHELVRVAARQSSEGPFAEKTAPIDETLIGFDLDGDGAIAANTTRITRLPSHYAGQAKTIPIAKGEHPLSTEFYQVRYAIDPEAKDLRGERVRELRYAKRIGSAELAAREARRLQRAERPIGIGDPLMGFETLGGSLLLGFVEDNRGRLRYQSTAEMQACLGCHDGSAGIPDGHYASLRQWPGSEGYGRQTLVGMPDLPVRGQTEGELLLHLRAMGRADPLREDLELEARLFPAGALDEALIRRAAFGGDLDMAALLMPSKDRALNLARTARQMTAQQTRLSGGLFARPVPLQKQAFRPSTAPWPPAPWQPASLAIVHP